MSRSRGAEVRLLLPAQSSPGAFRAASLGEIGAFHLGQLCKQVPQCFKGTFSCDFSQLKKKKKNRYEGQAKVDRDLLSKFADINIEL